MAGRKKKEEDENLSLEDAFQKLNGMIEQLESSDISLEESFQVYKKGMETLKYCNDTIDKVEKKVLVLSEDGSLDEF